MEENNLITYKISEDHLLLAEQQHITPHISNILTEIHDDVVKGKKKLIPKLIKLSLKYPKVPQFKNNLASVYQAQGNTLKAYETNKWVVAEHPNYLFGKLNLANEYIYKEEFEKVPKILGELLEISALFPERNEFHVDELMSFNATAINYFLGIDDLEQAQLRLDLMKDIDEENPKIEQAMNMMMFHNLKSAPDFFRKQQEQMIQVTVPNLKASIQTIKKPTFHFPNQMNYLYTSSTDISEKLIKEILSLDIKKLSEDLVTILNDSIIRFDYYKEQVDEKGWNKDNYSFLTHALFLLSEIKSPKTLGEVLNIARQDEEYFEFWFGDLMKETYGFVIYELAKGQLTEVFNFLTEPNIYCYVKSVIVESTLSNVNNHPNINLEITAFCDDLLSFYIENKDDEGIVDTEFFGLFISDLIDFRGVTLLPKIKQMFDLNLVGYWICGDFNSVEKEILSKKTGDCFDFNISLFEKYQQMNKYTFVNNDEYENLSEEIVSEPIVSSKKIGRNEPCPCGSGKKHKKCCINK